MPEKKYRSRGVATAHQVDECESIVTSNGVVYANKGDYIVSQTRDDLSFTFVLTEDDFERDWVEWRQPKSEDDTASVDEGGTGEASGDSTGGETTPDSAPDVTTPPVVIAPETTSPPAKVRKLSA